MRVESSARRQMSFCGICAKRTTVVQIADIDAKRGGAMALDYDTCKKKPWVAADDGYGNRMARSAMNGSSMFSPPP